MAWGSKPNKKFYGPGAASYSGIYYAVYYSEWFHVNLYYDRGYTHLSIVSILLNAKTF